MEKKIAILVRTGRPYRRTILYGVERAREIGARILLVGVIPDMDVSRRVGLAIHEYGPYETIAGKVEDETGEFLERVIQFCLDNGIAVETQMEKGGMEGVVKKLVTDKSIRLVIVPTPSKSEHHSEFLDTIRHFAHDIVENELKCPVVSVLAT